MKSFFKTLENVKMRKLCALLLSVCLAALFFTGCSSKKITYSDAVLPDGSVGADYSQSIATATGSDDITYTMKTGSNLPLGLDLENGIIKGVPTQAVKNATFTIVASAEGLNDAEAEFTLSIQMSYPTYGLSAGRVGDAYSISVAGAEGADSISYTLKSGTNLPLGLALSSAGIISGTPSEAVSLRSFTVVASAAGIDSVEAQFSITIYAEGAEIPEIVYQSSALPDGMTKVAYSKSVATATASGTVEYNIKTGAGSLPAGLSLSKQGLLSGTPTVVVTDRAFTVVASAQGHINAEAEFTITVVEGATFIMEAEFANVDGVTGTGLSGTGGGLGLISRDYTGQNKVYREEGEYVYDAARDKACYITYCYRPEFCLDYWFTSDIDVPNATLVMRLGNEVGTEVSGIGPDALRLMINGETIDYQPFALGTSFEFTDIFVTDSFDIKAGDNEFTFIIMDNDLYSLVGGTFECYAPCFDCFKVTAPAAADLRWTASKGYPYIDNIKLK